MSTTPPGDRMTSAQPSGTPSAGLDLGVAQVAGSALAAVTAALAASTLGVAGTILGAGVGAIVATVGSALYAHSLRRATERVRQLRLMEMRPTGGVRWPAPRSRASADAEPPTVPLTTATEPLPAEPEDAGRRPWRRSALMIAGGFALALAGITAAEAVIGHPLSSSKESGTSVGRAVTGDGGGGSSTPSTSTPSTSQTGSPTSSATSQTSSPTSVSTSSPAEQQAPSSTAPSATAPAASPTGSPEGSATSPAGTSSSSEAPAPRATSAPAGDGSP